MGLFDIFWIGIRGSIVEGCRDETNGVSQGHGPRCPSPGFDQIGEGVGHVPGFFEMASDGGSIVGSVFLQIVGNRAVKCSPGLAENRLVGIFLDESVPEAQ